MATFSCFTSPPNPGAEPVPDSRSPQPLSPSRPQTRPQSVGMAMTLPSSTRPLATPREGTWLRARKTRTLGNSPLGTHNITATAISPPVFPAAATAAITSPFTPFSPISSTTSPVTGFAHQNKNYPTRKNEALTSHPPDPLYVASPIYSPRLSLSFEEDSTYNSPLVSDAEMKRLFRLAKSKARSKLDAKSDSKSTAVSKSPSQSQWKRWSSASGPGSSTMALFARSHSENDNNNKSDDDNDDNDDGDDDDNHHLSTPTPAPTHGVARAKIVRAREEESESIVHRFEREISSLPSHLRGHPFGRDSLVDHDSVDGPEEDITALPRVPTTINFDQMSANKRLPTLTSGALAEVNNYPGAPVLTPPEAMPTLADVQAEMAQRASHGRSLGAGAGPSASDHGSRSVVARRLGLRRSQGHVRRQELEELVCRLERHIEHLNFENRLLGEQVCVVQRGYAELHDEAEGLKARLGRME